MSRDNTFPSQSAVGPDEPTTAFAKLGRGQFVLFPASMSSGLPLSCQKAVEALLLAWLIRLVADPLDVWDLTRGIGNEAAMIIVNVDSVKLEITKTNPIAT
jgi:hypothetical protein